ncbi:MAG: glycosyltransferase [bacterium]
MQYPRNKDFPKISILVALRNEAKSVRACVQSLLRLDYPEDALEILLINDRSFDQTGAIIEELSQNTSHIRTTHIQRGLPGLSGKANAIAQGIEHCSGEIVLVTDGDCRVPRSWARAHVSYYQDHVGLVGGFTLLDEKNDCSGRFGKVQSLDWAYLLSVGTGAMGFGLPLSVLGNNFSFRRKAYEAVGGYRAMGFTIIEDFALMKTLLEKTTWEVRYPIDPQMVVTSRPMANFKEFYQQRKRWSAGGKEVGIYGKFLMFLSHFTHILLPLSFVLAPNVLFPILGLTAVVVADFLLLFRTTGLVERRDLLRWFPTWEAFYFCYTTLFAPVLLFPTTVVWKDIAYSWNFNWKMARIEEK